MSVRVFAVAVATALVAAAPVAAQQRGTMEFGAFASGASFDNALSLDKAVGGGGRVGMFLDPRWALEFEKGEMKASRPDGLAKVNVGIVAGRLVVSPFKAGPLAFLLGAGGGVSTETNFLHSYGFDALAGARIALGDNAALRVDGVFDWLANEKWKSYQSVRVGLSLYRHPTRAVRTITETRTRPQPIVTNSDSVSGAETARLRARDAALTALRDSLYSSVVTARAYTSAETMSTMEAPIHFAFNKSTLTDSAKALLDAKVAVARANPAMTIIMLGYTDVKGTDAYNMELGTRRAQAAKDYIVKQGILPYRVILETRGERRQIAGSAGAEGEAPNRRAIFRLLIAPDVILKQ
jgi:outer membrane protein OmpA-like peptidoglycan-associated protein